MTGRVYRAFIVVFIHPDKACSFITDEFQPHWSSVPAWPIDGQTSIHGS